MAGLMPSAISLELSTFYWNMWDELATHDDLLNGDRLIIPMALLENYLKDLSENYTGIEKSQTEACTTIYCPGIDIYTADYICCCRVCIQSKPFQGSEPLLSCGV